MGPEASIAQRRSDFLAGGADESAAGAAGAASAGAASAFGASSLGASALGASASFFMSCANREGTGTSVTQARMYATNRPRDQARRLRPIDRNETLAINGTSLDGSTDNHPPRRSRHHPPIVRNEPGERWEVP